MSHGVRLVLTPNRAATIHPAQLLTAAMPDSAPRIYRDAVGFVGSRAVVLASKPMPVSIARSAPPRWLLSDLEVDGAVARDILSSDPCATDDYSSEGRNLA